MSYRDDVGTVSYGDGPITTGGESRNNGENSGHDDDDYFGMIFGSGATTQSQPPTNIFLILLVFIGLFTITMNGDGLFTLLSLVLL